MKIKEDAVLQALMTQRTIKEAAKAAKVSERVMYDYLKDPAFLKRYNAARDDLIRGVSSHLQSLMHEAIDVVAENMRSKKARPSERTAAAKTIMEFAGRYAEMLNVSERITKLEEKLEQDSA